MAATAKNYDTAVTVSGPVDIWLECGVPGAGAAPTLTSGTPVHVGMLKTGGGFNIEAELQERRSDNLNAPYEVRVLEASMVITGDMLQFNAEVLSYITPGATLDEGGAMSNTSRLNQYTESKPLNLEEFKQMRERFKNNPPVMVGVVCRPELLEPLRRRIKAVKTGNPFELSGVTAWLPVYADRWQAQQTIAFTSEVLLRAYINRRNGPEAWNNWGRCCMRDTLKASKGFRLARRYAVPLNVRPIVELDEARLMAKAREMDGRK